MSDQGVFTFKKLSLNSSWTYSQKRASRYDVLPVVSAHVETVCLFSKLSRSKNKIEVTLDMDDLDVTSAETKATYDEIKKYVAEHNDGMQMTNPYIAQ